MKKKTLIEELTSQSQLFEKQDITMITRRRRRIGSISRRRSSYYLKIRCPKKILSEG